MFKIIEKKQLSADVFYMKVNAPEIARNRKAGQFVLVQIDVDYGERQGLYLRANPCPLLPWKRVEGNLIPPTDCTDYHK